MYNRYTYRSLLLLPLLAFFINAYPQQKKPLLRFSSRQLTTSADIEKFNPDQLSKSRFRDNYYLIIQFNELPNADRLAQLKNAGVELLQYVPDNAYWVKLSKRPEISILKSLKARTIYQPSSADKLAVSLKKSIRAASGEELKKYTLVYIKFFKGVALADMDIIIKASGGSVINAQMHSKGILKIQIPVNKIDALASASAVCFLSPAVQESTPINYSSRTGHSLDALTSSAGAGRNLRGQGMVLGIGDNADPTSHIDIIDRTINRNPLGYNGHGTHTTGTLAGAGLIDELAAGYAPESTIISDLYDNIIVNTETYYNDFGMAITNNSYYDGLDNCPGNGEYDILSSYGDQQINSNTQFLHVFASGNDGKLTCSPYPAFFHTVKSGWQTGKNILTVGAGNSDDYSLADFSSIGPVNDGRIKPEIVADGWEVRSTTPNNTYGNAWGTSMAAPAVTGTAGLLYERYKQLNSGSNPNSALIKALLCNSADDKGNPGPDYKWGFGWMNARRAVEDLEDHHYISGTLTNGATNTHSINVPSGVKQLKVMVYWHDVEAALMSSVALVNDIDMTLKMGASTWQPWILDGSPAGCSNNAITGEDHLNNIEQISVDNPAAGSYTVNINGFNIPSGPQEYFVVYDFVMQGIVLEYPYGGERWKVGRAERIRWSANDGSSNPFTLEYSTNNGSSWNTIDNNISPLANNYLWTVANSPTNQALVRISRNSTAYSDVCDDVLTFLNTATLNVSVPCEGYAQLSWNAIAGATDYEVLQSINGQMESIATTGATSYLVSGLNSSTRYWFAIRGRLSGMPGLRSNTRNVIPSTGVCTLSNFNNDLKMDSILAPVTGRKFTSSELTASTQITVRIKNLDDVATSGSYIISYQVNGGSIVTESSPAVINALATANYTFTAPYDFSATGSYTLRVWVKNTGDTQVLNDSLTATIKQLANDAVTLPFSEGFETAASGTYLQNATGIDGLDRGDFMPSSSNGRLRTFVNTGFARSGSRAMTIDANHYNAATTTNNFYTTVNLSSYAATQGLRLDFWYRSHQQTAGANNFVWIRGSGTDSWVRAYDLVANQASNGNYKQAVGININELLAGAGQAITSSFQIRFGEQGKTSANQTYYAGSSFDLDDGFTFDDLRIVQSTDDIEAIEIATPGISNCGLSAATSISAKIKNTTSTTFNNVPVYYRINGGTPVMELIPVIAANTTITYTFSSGADLSAYQQYIIDVWVKNPSDNYPENDSITNYTVRNNPLVSTFPYLQTFESNDGYWYSGGTNSSWEWGVPAGNIIDTAASGVKAWVTNLDGNYNSLELGYLYSPCFDLSGMAQPVLSFSHIFRTEDNCTCDFHWVEYSDDGVNWTKLGSSGNGTNWYDNASIQAWQASDTIWNVSSIDVPTTGSSVRFRFVMSSDPAVQYEGVGIDDIHIFDKATIYGGPSQTGLTKPVSGNSWIDFDYGGERVVSINPMGQDLGSTSVQVHINTNPVRWISDQYYLDRNLVIQSANAPSGNVRVRFYLLESEANALINATGCSTCSKPKDIYEVGVTKYSGTSGQENGTLADNDGGAYRFILPANVDIVPFNNGYYAEFEVNSFCEFWINNGGPNGTSTFSVQLESFEAIKNTPDVDLNWVTLDEANADQFIIERRAEEEPTFQPVATIKAKGNSGTENSYSYTDKNIFNFGNVFYYRLKMVDLDGNYTYSQVEKVSDENTDLFIKSLFPSLTNGELRIVTGGMLNISSLQTIIYSSTGQVVLKKTMAYKTQTLNVNNLATGIYMMVIRDNSGKEKFTFRFVKK